MKGGVCITHSTLQSSPPCLSLSVVVCGSPPVSTINPAYSGIWHPVEAPRANTWALGGWVRDQKKRKKECEREKKTHLSKLWARGWYGNRRWAVQRSLWSVFIVANPSRYTVQVHFIASWHTCSAFITIRTYMWVKWESLLPLSLRSRRKGINRAFGMCKWWH